MNEKARAKKISAFWAWFDSFKTTLDDANPPEEHHLDEILKHIRPIEPGLAVELSMREDGIKEITISADGDREKFPIVEQIVSQAPSIEGWEVIAFRQPAPGDFSLQCGDLELTPSELYFQPVEEDGALDVIVYGQGFGDVDENELSYHGLTMIDALIGEYDCVMQVRYYEFRELPDEPDREGLLPLSQLPSFIDARK